MRINSQSPNLRRLPLLGRWPAVGCALLLACLALPAAAADGADEGGPEDSPMWSPEAVRDLGVQPDMCESDDSGQQASFGPRAQRQTIRLAKYTAKSGDTVRGVAYRYFSSPSLLAYVNRIAFDRAADPALPVGQVVQIPIARGSLSGFAQGEQLTPGPGIQMSLSNMDRKWGRPQVVKNLRQALNEVFKRWPQRHPAIVGSLSRAGGGRLGHHKSHRSGQDIDIGYYTHASTMKDWGTPRLTEIDYERTWFLVDWLERSGHAAAVFMAPSIQRNLYAYAANHGVPPSRLRMIFEYGPKGSRGDTLIRKMPGHRDHMHIRLWVPEDMGDVRAKLGV